MKLSNFTVNLAIRSRSSSNPKLILGSVSAIDGASAELRGGRIALVDRDGSNAVDIVKNNTFSVVESIVTCCAFLFRFVLEL